MLNAPFFSGNKLQDFTSYTEQDANNKLTVTALKLTGVDVDWDEDVYCYRNFGASHFNAFKIEFELYMSSATLVNGLGACGLSNTVDDFSQWGTTAVSASIRDSAGTPNILLYRGAGIASDSYTCATNTLYYCTLLRAAAADTIYLFIYSDASRTTLLDTLSVAGFGTATRYQYLFGFVNFNNASTGRDWDGYIQNMMVY